MMKKLSCLLVTVIAMIIAQTAFADTHYVSLQGTNNSPYLNWADAATNIQAAITTATDGDTVLVSNGVYEVGGIANWPAGGLLTNRVAITRTITVQSLNNDPLNTIIKGAGPCGPSAIRGVYFGRNNSMLVGFTVIEGATLTADDGGVYEDRDGGGVNGPGIISNCIIIGNAGTQHGGGIVYAKVYNSQIISNTSTLWGGGQSQGKIYNSIIRHNKGAYGAGTWGAVLDHCIIAHNDGVGAYFGNQINCLNYGNDIGVSLQDGKYLDACTIVGCRIGVMIEGGRTASILNSIIYSNTADNWRQNDTCVIAFTNTCTTPTNSIAWAIGNITNNPLLVDFGAGYGTNHITGNYRLQANSPCVNSGLNQAWMAGGLDLDSHSRLDRFSGMVDIGCYEYLPNGMMFKVR